MGNTNSKRFYSKYDSAHFDIQALIDENDMDKLNAALFSLIEDAREEDDLDAIAANYIVTMDYPSIKQLQEKEYCNKITGLSANLIYSSLDEPNVVKWHQRVGGGSTNMKREMCIDIARFYTKIGHLFSAIMMAINPQYFYMDKTTGKYKKVGLEERHLIPEDTIVDIVTSGLCQKRIDLLVNKQFLSPKYDPSLVEETGIPELMDLYYDADYNKQTGTFHGMNHNTSEEYKNDVDLFYKTFTGEERVPENITSFSDIRLKDYGKKQPSFEEKEFKNRIYSYRSSLILSYAENIRKMMYEMTQKHERLLDILNLFFYSKQERKGVIILIHRNMTEETLNTIIEEARNIIVSLYLHCEKDYERGLQMYEAIVESLILDTSQKQIKTLEQELEHLFS